MRSLGARYTALVGTVASMFATFVACGSQLYRVSLQGDTETPSTVASGGGGAAVEGSNDPSSVNYGLHAPSGWDALPIHFKVDATMNQDQVKGLTKAMHIWEMAVGRKLFSFDGVHTGVTGDSFSDLYSSLGDHINGHYLDGNWDKTGKPTVVLATTIWDNDPDDVRKIVTADIRFNNDYYLLGDSLTLKPIDQREVVDIQTLALHELGHLLGLAHISPQIDPQSIMTASLYIGEGLTNRHLSTDDIKRIQKIYGCQGDACDIEKTMAAIDKLDEKPKVAAKTTTEAGETSK